jgi:phytoene synthase
MEMDLAVRRYETFDDLRLYCYRAAATIGLICVEIFGHGGTETGPAIEAPAIELGLAMQLTNIIRDVGEDVARDRIYLPAAELARFGVSGADLRAGVMTAGMRALLEFQVERARGYFARAEALFPQIDRAARYCPILLKRFYAELLDKVEAAGHDVFRRRVRLSRPRKLYLAGSCWLKSRLWRGADHTSSR